MKYPWSILSSACFFASSFLSLNGNHSAWFEFTLIAFLSLITSLLIAISEGGKK